MTAYGLRQVLEDDAQRAWDAPAEAPDAEPDVVDALDGWEPERLAIVNLSDGRRFAGVVKAVDAARCELAVKAYNRHVGMWFMAYVHVSQVEHPPTDLSLDEEREIGRHLLAHGRLPRDAASLAAD